MVGGKENRTGKFLCPPAARVLALRPGLDVPGKQEGGLAQGRLEDQRAVVADPLIHAIRLG